MSLAHADLNGRDARPSTVEDAHAILALHAAGPDGYCQGCLDGWARLALAPCSVARRWLSVVETHGVAEWDSRPRRTGCEACEGRGWKFVSTRAEVATVDDGPWTRLWCMDCGFGSRVVLVDPLTDTVSHAESNVDDGWLDGVA